jgi:hypothetical protein
MNKIFERVADIEEKINELIEDLLIEAEECPINKDEIEHELISASRAVGRVYNLNKENFNND